jgi:hypothetical protein
MQCHCSDRNVQSSISAARHGGDSSSTHSTRVYTPLLSYAGPSISPSACRQSLSVQRPCTFSRSPRTWTHKVFTVSEVALSVLEGKLLIMFLLASTAAVCTDSTVNGSEASQLYAVLLLKAAAGAVQSAETPQVWSVPDPDARHSCSQT